MVFQVDRTDKSFHHLGISGAPAIEVKSWFYARCLVSLAGQRETHARSLRSLDGRRLEDKGVSLNDCLRRYCAPEYLSGKE